MYVYSIRFTKCFKISCCKCNLPSFSQAVYGYLTRKGNPHTSDRISVITIITKLIYRSSETETESETESSGMTNHTLSLTLLNLSASLQENFVLHSHKKRFFLYCNSILKHYIRVITTIQTDQVFCQSSFLQKTGFLFTLSTLSRYRLQAAFVFI